VVPLNFVGIVGGYSEGLPAMERETCILISSVRKVQILRSEYMVSHVLLKLSKMVINF
jgi:hypothetical protein